MNQLQTASKQHQPRSCLYQLKALMVGVAPNLAAAPSPLGCFSIQGGNPAKPSQAQSLCFGPFHACLCIGSISSQPLGITASLNISAWMLKEAIPNILPISAIARILARDLLNLVLHLFKVMLYFKSIFFPKSTRAVLVSVSVWDSAPPSVTSVWFSSPATCPSKLLILSDISLYLSSREERGHWRISCRVSSSSRIDPSRLRLERGQHGSEAEPSRICWGTFEPAACHLKSLSPPDTFVPQITTKYRMYSSKDATFPTWGI